MSMFTSYFIFLPYKKNTILTFIGNFLLKLIGVSFPVDLKKDFILNFLIFFIYFLFIVSKKITGHDNGLVYFVNQ